MPNQTDRILLAADMAGPLVFAVEGALAGGGSLDLLGVMVLAFATALGGGIVRDVLAALRSWRYAAVAFAGGAIYILPCRTF